jgi:hypothetical protein
MHRSEIHCVWPLSVSVAASSAAEAATHHSSFCQRVFGF